MNYTFDQKWELITEALNQTVYMVLISGALSALIGILIGFIVHVTSVRGIMPNKFINIPLDIIINIGRSIPFPILAVALFPLARIIVGTSIGTTAAVVPLTISAIPFIARITSNSLQEVDKGVIESSISFGANNFDIIRHVLLPEVAPNLINGVALAMVSLIGASAMAGILGGGGLGYLAYAYGFQRNQTDILYITIILVVLLVQITQLLGQIISKKLNHR